MEYYSFGAWPAIAMLLGIGLAKAEEKGRGAVLDSGRAPRVVGIRNCSRY